MLTTTAFSNAPTILVVDDVDESRSGIHSLLSSDGYIVETARSAEDAIRAVVRMAPDLILLNLGGAPHEAIAIAQGIRQKGMPNSMVPIVLFCVEWVADGENVDCGDYIYVAHPDNFNQLREFLRLLLSRERTAS